MAAMRTDAARSRARILEAARDRPPGSLRFNDLARETGLGVGTIYRHFATVTALIEALNIDALQLLASAAHRIAESPSPGTEFADLVKICATELLARDGLKELLISPDVSPDVRAVRDAFRHDAAVALNAAIREGRIRPDISFERIQHLACGVEYAARLGDPADYPILLDVMVAGLRPHDEATG